MKKIILLLVFVALMLGVHKAQAQVSDSLFSERKDSIFYVLGFPDTEEARRFFDNTDDTVYIRLFKPKQSDFFWKLDVKDGKVIIKPIRRKENE